jgi:hypothetical protein
MREMDPIRDVSEDWSPPIGRRDVARGFSFEKIELKSPNMVTNLENYPFSEN